MITSRDCYRARGRDRCTAGEKAEFIKEARELRYKGTAAAMMRAYSSSLRARALYIELSLSLFQFLAVSQSHSSGALLIDLSPAFTWPSAPALSANTAAAAATGS